MLSKPEPKNLDEWKAIRMVESALNDPRNAPHYQAMVDECHRSENVAEAVVSNESISIGEVSFDSFGDTWVVEEIAACVNEDAADPTTCSECRGNDRDTTPCNTCKKGRDDMTKFKTKKRLVLESKCNYLQRELTRLAEEFEHVEKQLMDFDKQLQELDE